MHLCVALHFTAFLLAVLLTFYTRIAKDDEKQNTFPVHLWINYYLLFIQHVVFRCSMKNTHDIFIGVLFFACLLVFHFFPRSEFVLSPLFMFLFLYCITKIVAYHTDKE